MVIIKKKEQLTGTKKQNSVQKHSFSYLLPVWFLQCSVLTTVTAEGNTRELFLSSCAEGVICSEKCVVEGVMLSVSAGSSSPVVCLVSYPAAAVVAAAAAAAAAAAPDQGRSFLCHDRQTDLRS